MAEMSDKKPGYLSSIFSMKCPRCRKGPMFNNKNPYKKISSNNIFSMPEHCAVCGQKYDLEPGFWYGTGYLSYALAVAICVSSFVAWAVLLGISVRDNSIFQWLIFNTILLVVLQPWLMRLSRVIYIRFFVGYDKEYDKNAPKKFM